MIKVKPENIRRSRGEFPQEMRLSLAKETIELMDRHVPIGNVEGRRGAASPFADLGIRVLCALLSGDIPETDDVADALSRVLGDDKEGLLALGEMSRNALLLSGALDRRAHEMRWALSEIPK
jgi:hypothetical protein